MFEPSTDGGSGKINYLPLAVDQLKLSNTYVADRLNLTPSSVSKLVNRGRL